MNANIKRSFYLVPVLNEPAQADLVIKKIYLMPIVLPGLDVREVICSGENCLPFVLILKQRI